MSQVLEPEPIEEQHGFFKHYVKIAGRKARCALCHGKILIDAPYSINNGLICHDTCIEETKNLDNNVRRRTLKLMGIGAAFAGATAIGASRLASASGVQQTQITANGVILPSLTSDPANPEPGQMWYRSDAGVIAHFDAIENRVIYSNRIVDGSAVVSAKGIANGLSVLPNDGQDWGPDTMLGATAPGQYGGPYTKTLGIQEAGEYAYQNKIYKVKAQAGLYLLDTTINLSNVDGVTLEGSGSGITSGGVVNYPTAFVTVFAPSSTFSSNLSFNYNIPAQSVSTYYPLIYVLGKGANSSQTGIGTNLEFKNFILSGAVGAISNNSSTVAGLYAAGVWNLVVNHLDTQNCQIGHYISMNGTSGNSMWIANSTNEESSVLGGYYHIDEGLIYAVNAQGCINSFDIGGNGADVPMTAIGLSWDYGPTYLGYVTIVGSFNDGSTNGAVIYLSNNTILIGCWLTQRDNVNADPIFGPYLGTTPENNVAIGCTFVGSNDSTEPTPLFSGVVNSGSPKVLTLVDCMISNVTGSYIANPPIQISGNGSLSQFEVVRLHNYTFSPTTPTVPTTGTAQENTNPYVVDTYLYGGTVTEIQITRNGNVYTVFSNSTGLALSGQVYKLNPGDSITITYTTSPTWEWLSD